MSDRELLEQILQKINKVDTLVESLKLGHNNLEDSLGLVNNKLDALSEQVAKNSEQIQIIKEQTAANSEIKAPLDAVIAKVEDIETDLKVVKKAITSN